MKSKILIPFRALLTLALVVTIFFTLPQNFNPKTEGYQASSSRGNLLNVNTLSFTLNPAITGIKGVAQSNNLKLTIPYFFNTRYLTVSNYLPLIGERKHIIELYSINKYQFEVTKTSDKLSSTFSIIQFLTLSIYLLLFFFFYRRKLSGTVAYLLTDRFILIFGFLELSLLLHAGYKTLLSALLLALYLFLNSKIKFIALFLSIALLLVYGLESKAEFNYSLISNDKAALSALSLISSPAKVADAIKYVEKANTINGKLDLVACHKSLHELGMLTYLKYKDPVKTMKATITNCEFGYLHGSEDGISLLTTGVLESQAMYQAGCKAIYTGKNDNTYDECVHGSGHAFYELYSGDSDQAFKACEIWGKDANICQVAVTMSLGDYLTFHNDGTYLPDFCMKVTDSVAKLSCVMTAFRYVITEKTAFPEQLSKASAFCEKLSKELADGCYFSIGDGLAYQLRNHFDQEDPNWGSTYCSFKGKINETCYMTFIRYMSYYHSLYGKPVTPAFYCDKLPFASSICVAELTKQENRPAN